ncbi:MULTISPECIES: ABC transporter substrate-binding protein [unclassified Deinococcus]|uniref:ABC transporter substrate-binding protein n=1 Tax=unclassified Deinococcus TaxID=2623546 RepID=UPI000993F761|nr:MULTISPECIES: ABC transporter substrate-binding protein [unclassified Deinococcus]MCD0164353.1 ABC transporter substrate-binding protein [Deinococcus sp. 12RED42]OOV15421.1 peptide-binding protein [Deinococcus sp. LM3]
MKKVLTLALALTVGNAAAQSAFVWPAAWTGEQNTANKRGGELRLSAISDFKTFNPFTSSEADSITQRMTEDSAGLFFQDPRNDEFIPYMAASAPVVSNNNKRFVVKIRQGMKFSDGQAITADDWITTWKIHTDDKVGSNSRDTFFLIGKPITVKKLDTYTLQFDFPQPSASALSIMSYAPWPDHVFGKAYREGGAEAIKKMWTLATPPSQIVSPGAWVLESYRAGERAVFKKNNNWGDWNKDGRGQELPYLNNLSVRIVADANAALAAFLAGQLDTVAMRNADDLAQTKKAIDAGNLKAFLKANVSPQATSQWITFNWNKASDPAKQKLFRDVRFRRAMSHIANRQAMVQLALGGLGSETYFSTYPIFKQQIDAGLSAGAPTYKYNLAEASRLLGQLGYTKKNAQGFLVDKAGKVLEFNLSTNAGNTVREQLGRIFADEAKKVGVKVNFTPIDFNTLVSQLTSKGENRPFDAILLGLSGGSNIWSFGSNVVPCGTNLHSYNNPTDGKCATSQEQLMTKLYYQGDAELNDAKRRAIGGQLMKVEGELQPVIYLVGGNYHVAYNERLGGEFTANMMDAYYGHRYFPLTFVK